MSSVPSPSRPPEFAVAPRHQTASKSKSCLHECLSHTALCSLTGSSNGSNKNKWKMSKWFLSKSELTLGRRHLLYYTFFRRLAPKLLMFLANIKRRTILMKSHFCSFHVSFPNLSFFRGFKWCNGGERLVGTRISDFIWMSRQRRRHQRYNAFCVAPWMIALSSWQMFRNVWFSPRWEFQLNPVADVTAPPGDYHWAAAT